MIHLFATWWRDNSNQSWVHSMTVYENKQTNCVFQPLLTQVQRMPFMFIVCNCVMWWIIWNCSGSFCFVWIFFYDGSFWTVLNKKTLSWIVLYCFGSFWTVLDHFVLCGIILNFLDPFRLIHFIIFWSF